MYILKGVVASEGSSTAGVRGRVMGFSDSVSFVGFRVSSSLQPYTAFLLLKLYEYVNSGMRTDLVPHNSTGKMQRTERSPSRPIIAIHAAVDV